MSGATPWDPSLLKGFNILQNVCAYSDIGWVGGADIDEVMATGAYAIEQA